MFELIMSCLLHCTGLPRFARNDEAHTRHCEERKRRGNPVHAFTLVELLVSLIIISIITSAFVPMLSKKLKHREISYSAVKQMKIDCTPYDTTDGSCLLCTETQCNLCTSSINIPNGYYVDPTVSCNRQECSTPFPNCKRCTKAGCQECDNGYTLETNGTCSQVKCNKGYRVVNSACEKCAENSIQPNDNSTATTCNSCSADEVSNAARTQCTTVTCPSGQYRSGRICLPCQSPCATCSGSATNCDSCISGYALSGHSCNFIPIECTPSATQYKKSTSECPECSSAMAHCTSCTSATNCTACELNYKTSTTGCVYDPCYQYDAVYIAEGSFCMKKKNLGDIDAYALKDTYYTNTATGTPRCWKNLSYSYTDPVGASYSAGGRILCNFYAGKEACQSINWNLPTYEQLKIIAEYGISKYNTQLLLCSSDSSNRPYCANSSASGISTIYVRDVVGYAKDKANGTSRSYIKYEKNGFAFGNDSNYGVNKPYTVRCVKSL